MKVFVAGATGAIGRKLVPLLVAGGHRVVATTRKRERAESLRAQGAEPVLVEGLDREGVMQAVTSSRPDAVVHQMTSISPMLNPKHFDEELAMTNRLRTEGTSHLLDAARAAGAKKFIAQSYTGWPNEREGGRVKTEEDPLDSHPPEVMKKTLEAILALERMVTASSDVKGTALRYGSLYGPGTSLAEDSGMADMVRQRKFPLIGGGTGVWSFLHVDDAARAAQLALERDAPGIYNIVDDEPAEVSEWLPELARVLGARPPMHLPAWIARLAVGEAGVLLMTQIRGASNAKAKRDLGFQPEYASWREGFRSGLAEDRLPAERSSAM